MSIGQLVTRGFGNGSLVGSIAKTVTAGYSIASFSATPSFRVLSVALEDRLSSITLVGRIKLINLENRTLSV